MRTPTEVRNLLTQLPCPPELEIFGIAFSSNVHADDDSSTTRVERPLSYTIQSMPSIGFNIETIRVPMSSGTTLPLANELQVGKNVSGAIVWLVDSSSADLLCDVFPLGNENPYM